MTHRIWRCFWLAILLGHGLFALAWWWLAPGGFGLSHPRFWSNRVTPPALLGLSIATLAALRQDRHEALRVLLSLWPAAWVSAVVMLHIAFPITMARLWTIPLVVAAAMGIAAIRPWTHTGERRWLATLLGLGGAVAAGAGAVGALRPPAPATHPRNDPVARIESYGGDSGRIAPGSVRLDSRVMVQTSDGTLIVRMAPLTIGIQPFLTFLSRSPDGAPTVLVRARDREGPHPRFLEGIRVGERGCHLFYEMRDQGPASLFVEAESGSDVIAIDSATRLERPVQSHLNSYCDVEIRGHRRLSLAFSPCPDVRVEVLNSDYPVGRPARFAFVEGDRTFRVVEASSGEKGPFRTLARGRLDPDQPLTIVLHDQGRAVARLSLADFAAQADTTLSPTAGWGVPVNAIEFRFIRRKRALGLKKVDMLTPLGVVSTDSKTGGQHVHQPVVSRVRHPRLRLCPHRLRGRRGDLHDPPGPRRLSLLGLRLPRGHLPRSRRTPVRFPAHRQPEDLRDPADRASNVEPVAWCARSKSLSPNPGGATPSPSRDTSWSCRGV